MGKLLLDSEPLIILPELAIKVGLNESIILQQIHYWLEINRKADKNLKDGFYWTYNTYKEWKKQFPFWSVSTIKRAIYNLEKLNIIISTSQYNKLQIDKTKWYRIDYEIVEKLENTPMVQNDTSIKNKDKNTITQNETSQNEPSNVSKCYDESVNLNRAIPETTSEISSEITKVVVEAYTNAKGKSLTKAEKNKLIELCNAYDKDIILKVIDMTIEQANNVNIKYIRTILESFKAKGLITLEEVETHLRSENNANKKARENRRKAVKSKVDTFNDYEQREYDFNDLEQQLLEAGRKNIDI